MKKTNRQILKEIMDKSAFGHLAEVFVMHSIMAEAEKYAGTDPSKYPEHSFISPNAWVGVAKEINAKLNQGGH